MSARNRLEVSRRHIGPGVGFTMRIITPIPLNTTTGTQKMLARHCLEVALHAGPSISRCSGTDVIFIMGESTPIAFYAIAILKIFARQILEKRSSQFSISLIV